MCVHRAKLHSRLRYGKKTNRRNWAELLRQLVGGKAMNAKEIIEAVRSGKPELLDACNAVIRAMAAETVEREFPEDSRKHSARRAKRLKLAALNAVRAAITTAEGRV